MGEHEVCHQNGSGQQCQGRGSKPGAEPAQVKGNVIPIVQMTIVVATLCKDRRAVDNLGKLSVAYLSDLWTKQHFARM